jgi:hypothetical protein
MRRRTSFGAVIVFWLTWAGVGLAQAEEPTEAPVSIAGAGLQNGVVVFLPTPPQQKLAGADIRVDGWDPSQPKQFPVKQWVPGASSQIRVADWRSEAPSRVPVKSWRPFAPSRIRVSTWQP